MIVTMEKVRLIGPRTRMAETVAVLQDVGTLHVCKPDLPPPLQATEPTPRQLRHARLVQRALDDIEETLSRLDLAADRGRPTPENGVEPLSREVRLARRARRAALRLVGEIRALEEERSDAARMLDWLEGFVELEADASRPDRHIVYLVLTRGSGGGLETLERALTDAIGHGFEVHTRALASGELAVALTVPVALADRVDALLPEVGVPEMELPSEVRRAGPRGAAREVRARLADLEQRIAERETRRRHLAEWLRPGLLRARAALHDWLIANEALGTASLSDHLFVMEGWLPADERRALERTLASRVGPEIVVEGIGRERWSAPDVPVAIRNPPLFRPFEVITRRLPAPRYGTLDPTPFVAIFFPVFFGLILGDVGYGAMLAGLSALGWTRSRPDSTLRAVSQVGLACAIFSILFGIAFGELFGDLGQRLFGWHTLSISREKAVVPFLILAVSIGFVHVVLGLILGALSGRRTAPRQSLGRGLTALMLVLTAAVLLAALNVLPGAFFKPSVVALLLSFPLLVLIEGFTGAVEFLSRVGNILSYARIMALGTASVMLATVANEMVGAMGGAVVGVLFATLFHLVNFGLGIFSPTIHGLRLHFVEFFGTFYSPGDQVYRPLRHWRPADGPAPQSA